MKKKIVEEFLKKFFKKDRRTGLAESKEELWAKNLFLDLGKLGGRIILMSK